MDERTRRDHLQGWGSHLCCLQLISSATKSNALMGFLHVTTFGMIRGRQERTKLSGRDGICRVGFQGSL